MDTATEPILEFLYEYQELWFSATGITINLLCEYTDPPSRATIYRSIKELSKRGFVEQIKVGDMSTHYRITDRAVNWLKGNLNASELDKDE